MRLITLSNEAAMAEDKGNYTNPDLRNRLKNKIKREGKGGKPGEWS